MIIFITLHLVLAYSIPLKNPLLSKGKVDLRLPTTLTMTAEVFTPCANRGHSYLAPMSVYRGAPAYSLVKIQTFIEAKCELRETRTLLSQSNLAILNLNSLLKMPMNNKPGFFNGFCTRRDFIDMRKENASFLIDFSFVL